MDRLGFHFNFNCSSDCFFLKNTEFDNILGDKTSPQLVYRSMGTFMLFNLV
jgi:hypothetical protein